MEKVATDIYTFESPREDGFTYVDKTGLLYAMASGEFGAQFFIARPRRFGPPRRRGDGADKRQGICGQVRSFRQAHYLDWNLLLRREAHHSGGACGGDAGMNRFGKPDVSGTYRNQGCGRIHADRQVASRRRGCSPRARSGGRAEVRISCRGCGMGAWYGIISPKSCRRR